MARKIPFVWLVACSAALVSGCARGDEKRAGASGSESPTLPDVDAATETDAGEPDAGPPTLYATLGSDTAPAAFASVSVTSYRAGYTIIKGSAVLDKRPGDVLPTYAELTIRIDSKTGTAVCDRSAPSPAVQLDLSPDSNANLKKTGHAYECTVKVKTFADRIVGTFSASFYEVEDIKDGVFDVPRGAEM